MSERLAAIVLAGGRSSRFGRDKLAEPIAGRPMLDHVIDLLRPIATDIVVVASAGAVPDVATDVSIANDDRPYEGPLAGLVAGLRSLDPGLERVLVVGGDMPTLVVPVLERLVDSLDRREAAVLADAGGPRPLPIAVRRAPATPVAERLLETGERRLRALLGELDVDVIPPETWQLDDPTGQTLRDVDVPGDLPA
jgi:molybdopterin-guanine dinucleotide biosynthesis protein A